MPESDEIVKERLTPHLTALTFPSLFHNGIGDPFMPIHCDSKGLEVTDEERV